MCAVHFDRHVPLSIHTSTVPIFVTHDDYFLDPERTGILFLIENRHFVLTAAHDIDQWLGGGSRLFASTGDFVHHRREQRGEETVELAITNPIILDKNPLDESKPIDVAILEIDGETADRLRMSKTFLSPEHLRVMTAPTAGAYLLFGHPEAIADAGDPSDRVPRARSPVCWFETDLTAPGTCEKYDKRNHLPLLYPNGLRHPGNGEPFEKGVKGMSGCGIWLVTYDQDGLLNGDARLVGIQHHQYRAERLILGTTLRCVVEKLASTYADLAEAVGSVSTL